MSHSLDSKTGVAGPVTVIKSYTVPADEADYFAEVYQENARIMSTQPGFLRCELGQGGAQFSGDLLGHAVQVDLGLFQCEGPGRCGHGRSQQDRPCGPESGF
ncbi:antibiotic biosynthesis monooxygenase family protein [Streptomyces sp. GESEQ-4]|uniref:antibiotic biosynthesis monooxygenase family protein n=1 Tax=Streptomyces sp. GESEQ-4 TaxID=2812655 RepID=UPI001B31C3B9|nr:antibiotic biosynthesis monooxygenase family protein [Streptomyces sp. GESEQ-4]